MTAYADNPVALYQTGHGCTIGIIKYYFSVFSNPRHLVVFSRSSFNILDHFQDKIVLTSIKQGHN